MCGDVFKGTDTFGAVPWKESLPWRNKNFLNWECSASINEIVLQWGGVGERLRRLLGSVRRTESKPRVTKHIWLSHLSFWWCQLSMKDNLQNRCVNEKAQSQNPRSLYLRWEAGSWGKWDEEGEGKQGNTGVSGWLDTMSLLWSKHAEIPIAHLTLTWLVSSLIWQACQGGRTNWGRNTQPLIILPGSSGLHYYFFLLETIFCCTLLYVTINELLCICYPGAARWVCRGWLAYAWVSRMQRVHSWDFNS